MASIPLEVRFWAKVDKRGDDDCWFWQGSTSGKYGAICIKKTKLKAHRLSWELHHAKPFPEGMCACHTCDNYLCVNPRHIWPGTNSDNMKDKVLKGRHHAQQITHCPRGHLYTSENTYYVGRKRHRTCKTCRLVLHRGYNAKRRASLRLAQPASGGGDE